MRQDFETALNAFVAAVQARKNAHTAANYACLTPPRYEVQRGKKFIRVVEVGPQESVWCFVRESDGAILKPESWSRPAKHERGNIYNADPLEGTNVWGPHYMTSRGHRNY